MKRSRPHHWDDADAPPGPDGKRPRITDVPSRRHQNRLMHQVPARESCLTCCSGGDDAADFDNAAMSSCRKSFASYGNTFRSDRMCSEGKREINHNDSTVKSLQLAKGTEGDSGKNVKGRCVAGFKINNLEPFTVEAQRQQDFSSNATKFLASRTDVTIQDKTEAENLIDVSVQGKSENCAAGASSGNARCRKPSNSSDAEQRLDCLPVVLSCMVKDSTGSREERSAGDADCCDCEQNQVAATAEKNGDVFANPNKKLTMSSVRSTISKFHFNFEDNVKLMDTAFRLITLGSFVVWLLLLLSVYKFTPSDQFDRVNDAEWVTAVISTSLHFVWISTKCVRLIVKHGVRAFSSAIVVGALMLQFMALSTGLIIVFARTPVMTDPVTGSCSHPVRFCQWTVSAFMLTFFTEGVDVPGEDDCDVEDRGQDSRSALKGTRFGRSRGVRRVAMRHIWRVLWQPTLMGTMQAGAAMQGLLFPYCRSWVLWTLCMSVSCVLFCGLFPRLFYKRRLFNGMARGHSVDEVETYERIRLSYRLLACCTITWSVVVIGFFFGALGPYFIDRDGRWGLLVHPSFSFSFDALFDVVAKAFYMDLIVEVYRSIFDEGARAARRLEEMRRMMSVVWGCSSDVIAISVRGHDGKVTTMLSPTYLKMCDLFDSLPEGFIPRVCFEGCDPYNQMAVVFEQNASDFIEPSIVSSSCAPVSAVSSKNKKLGSELWVGGFSCVDVADGRKMHIADSSFHEATIEVLLSIKSFMTKAWTTEKTDALLMHDLVVRPCSLPVRCEGKVTMLNESALVVVIRDVSERYRRFEAEKKAISEATARTKDTQANRFTRHEVKNGLLAALALCDYLRETIGVEEQNPARATRDGANRRRRKGPVVSSDESVAELDSTLREILDTVMSEAMARDVIHEVYEPKMERVNMTTILGTGRSHADLSSRFPLVTYPSPLPIFVFDPQLLRYIHRNAISNACKYGKRGGVVLTEVRYHQTKSVMELNVINLPGENHKSLLERGQAAQEAVFAAGTRLHDANHNLANDGQAWHSSGDGAWISQKCAKTFGGNCTIKFEKNRTIFSLRCPATTYEFASRITPGSVVDPSNFKLPEGTFGIAIDDSKIQRKLMHRFFSLVGIPTNKQVVLGSGGEEIRGFVEAVIRIVKDNPASYFLLIADENLDIVEDDTHHQTVSGSMCIKTLRQKLKSEDEKRVLALVRSANDSGSDIATYKSRAHGFLPKAPIKREKVIEMLAPLWAQRFPESVVKGSGEEARGEEAPSQYGDGDVLVSSSADLMQTLEVIDGLCLHNATALETRWPIVWEKFHALKGDLKTLQQSMHVTEALQLIDGLRGARCPGNLLSTWKRIQDLVVEAIRN